MNKIQEFFNIKDENIAEPDMYLGSTLSKMPLEGVNMCWTMMAEHYVKVKVTNAKENLSRDGGRLSSKCVTPLSSNYSLWLEESPKLKGDGVQRFQELIFHLCWVNGMYHGCIANIFVGGDRFFI